MSFYRSRGVPPGGAESSARRPYPPPVVEEVNEDDSDSSQEQSYDPTLFNIHVSRDDDPDPDDTLSRPSLPKDLDEADQDLGGGTGGTGGTRGVGGGAAGGGMAGTASQQSGSVYSNLSRRNEYTRQLHERLSSRRSSASGGSQSGIAGGGVAAGAGGSHRGGSAAVSLASSELYDGVDVRGGGPEGGGGPEEEEEFSVMGLIPRRPGASRVTIGKSGLPVVHVSLPSEDDDLGMEELSIKYGVGGMNALEAKNARDMIEINPADDDDISAIDDGMYKGRCYKFLQSKSFTRMNAAVAAVCVFGAACLFGFHRELVRPNDPKGMASSPLDGDPYAPAALGVGLPSNLEYNVADWTEGHFFGKTRDGGGSDRGRRKLRWGDEGPANDEERKMRRDTPFFWHVPLSGGVVAEDVFGSCLDLVQASEVGTVDGHGDDSELAVVQVYGDSYVNVDTSTSPGLQRARDMGLAASGMADVVISPLLHEASNLFSTNHRARLMVVLRDPVDRAVGMYFYLQKARWDDSYNPELSRMSLLEYATSSYVDNNWLTRFLLNKKGGSITARDVKVGKEILRRKAVIGMYNDLPGTLEHFERYFGWAPATDANRKCQERLIREGLRREHAHKELKEDSDEWRALYEQNRHDYELYEYGKTLASYQMWRMQQR